MTPETRKRRNYTEDFKRDAVTMLHNVAEDVRVVLIKLADRIQGKYTDKISTYRAGWQR